MPVLVPVGVALSAFFATTLGSIVLSVGLSAASYLINAALTPPINNTPGIDPGVKATLQADIYAERLIYGRALVGGRLFFYECKPPFLYYGLEIASHEIDAIEQIVINGKTVTFNSLGVVNSTNFINSGTPYVYYSVRKGGVGQTLDPLLAADFPDLEATFKQQGHACVVVKMYYGADAGDHTKYWGSSLPQCLFLVRGLKLYDPREPTQNVADNSTWKWSNSPSLAQAHFTTFAKGMNRPWSRIDLATLMQAATDDGWGVALASGGFEARYTCNGVVDTNAPPGENLQNLLTSNLGKMIWSNGFYKLLSGVPRSAVWTLNDDSARGDMEARTAREHGSLINIIRTVFVSSDREYQTVNGPVLTNAAYVALDGEEHEISITLPFTSSQTTAQRIAKATMEKARLGRHITRRESIEAVRLEAADLVNIEVPHLPILGGLFELNSFKLDHENFEIEIDAEEYASNVFAWTVADEQPFTIAPVNLDGVN